MHLSRLAAVAAVAALSCGCGTASRPVTSEGTTPAPSQTPVPSAVGGCFPSNPLDCHDFAYDVILGVVHKVIFSGTLTPEQSITEGVVLMYQGRCPYLETKAESAAGTTLTAQARDRFQRGCLEGVAAAVKQAKDEIAVGASY